MANFSSRSTVAAHAAARSGSAAWCLWVVVRRGGNGDLGGVWLKSHRFLR